MVAPKSHPGARRRSPPNITSDYRLAEKGSGGAPRARRRADEVGKGRETIGELVATEPDHKALFNKIMEVTRPFVEFDWANLFVYTPQREYSRIVCWYGPKIEYPMRWFYIEPAYRGWIDQTVTWMTDLKEDVANGPAPQLLDRADLKVSLEAGTKALIVLPVREAGEVKGGLCLMSRRKGIYDTETRKLLESLMLHQTLLAVLHGAERAKTQFVSDLIKKIADAKNLRELAATVVADVAHFYGFENTAIFKVNALRGRFELLAQELGFSGGTRMADSYAQPLDMGLLGLSYSRGEPILVNDVNDGSEEARHYHSFTPETEGSYKQNAMQSELCIPIELFGRILWIFNVEDRRTGAFNSKEQETLEGVFRQMQVMLERMFQRDILAQVLDMLPDGVVLLEQNGIVVRGNQEAKRLFQHDKAEGADISQFLDDPNSKASFTIERAAPSMTTIKGERGKQTPVLVSKFTLPEEYDHIVLVLRDLSKLQWRADFEGLKAALAEAVGQVRVPISLVASYVQQFEQRVSDVKLLELTKKALRQLGRIELTYDRVLAAYHPEALPSARIAKLDLRTAVDRILNDLPKLERSAVSLTAAEAPAVSADPYRLMFGLTSMLAYLLRARMPSERIAITVHPVKDSVEIAMTGTVHKSSPQGDFANLIEETRTQIALGEDALERLAKECGGSFTRDRRTDGRERLAMRLAAAH